MDEEQYYMDTINRFDPIIENLIKKHNRIIGMDRDDIRQELYIKVIVVLREKHKELGDDVYPYITTCLKNLVMDLIRTTNRYNYELLYDDLVHVKTNDLQVRPPLKEILDGLTKEEQTIALLYMDGFYQEEIGAIIGMSQQTISNRLRDIRSKIERNI
jgi:RNA polymerase sigma factor (sigma-70 family)